jgi:hypothetical protein
MPQNLGLELLLFRAWISFFDDERDYAFMQAKVADKGGRSAIEEMPALLNLAIST